MCANARLFLFYICVRGRSPLTQKRGYRLIEDSLHTYKLVLIRGR